MTTATTRSAIPRELPYRVGWRHRDGEYDVARIERTRDLDRRARGRPGREPVVDDHRVATGNGEARPIVAIPARPPLELDALLRFDPRQLLVADPCRPYDADVDDAHATFADRAHRELAVTGHTELPHQDHVEWGGQPPRDLGAHRHATARQCEYHWSIERDLLQLVGELLPGVHAVPEHHR